MKEADLQVQCMTWLKTQFPQYRRLCFHVPNGGTRNPVEAAHLKAQGVTPGVADIIIMVPSGKYHGAAIELKVGNNKPTASQQEFLANACKNGYFATLCWSLDEFIELIHTYFSHGR